MPLGGMFCEGRREGTDEGIPLHEILEGVKTQVCDVVYKLRLNDIEC